jgi:hypothetical protein
MKLRNSDSVCDTVRCVVLKAVCHNWRKPGSFSSAVDVESFLDHISRMLSYRLFIWLRFSPWPPLRMPAKPYIPERLYRPPSVVPLLKDRRMQRTPAECDNVNLWPLQFIPHGTTQPSRLILIITRALCGEWWMVNHPPSAKTTQNYVIPNVNNLHIQRRNKNPYSETQYTLQFKKQRCTRNVNEIINHIIIIGKTAIFEP